jgi:serine/threonine protein kinase
MGEKGFKAPPARIGPYRLDEQLGTGGMGAVYRAYHERLDRPVALKQIRPDKEGDSALRQRFLREARTAAQLSHPNIVQVYDILQVQESDWIVMEFAEGETLADKIEAGPLEVVHVLTLGLDLAQGLAAAHARGIVHRDLKAENVVVTPAGHAKILDFGLAKLQVVEEDAAISKHGEILGTPRAMSPEQANGKGVDHRSDLFSLGVLLYECLTGVSPFQGAGFTETLARILTQQQRSAHEVQPAIPRDLSGLVDRLLEKDPSHRPQSAEELVVALQRLRGTQQAPLKILFIDDEPDFEQMIRQLYRKEIRSCELVLEFANDGRQALRKIEQDTEIALLMLDIRMPEMDGLKLLGHVQKLERHLVTVMISAFGDMKNIRTAMNLGAFDFLIKPIDFEDLELTRQKAVAEVLTIRDRHRLREENRLLAQRNRHIREALHHHLSGDLQALRLGDRRQIPLVAQGKDLVVKAEIGGFQALSQGLEPQDLYAVLNRLVSKVLDVAGWHAGRVTELRDGTATILFGLPSPQDSVARRAMNCTLALRLALESISDLSVQCGGPELTLKVEGLSDAALALASGSRNPGDTPGGDEDEETLSPGAEPG